ESPVDGAPVRDTAAPQIGHRASPAAAARSSASSQECPLGQDSTRAIRFPISLQPAGGKCWLNDIVPTGPCQAGCGARFSVRPALVVTRFSGSGGHAKDPLKWVTTSAGPATVPPERVVADATSPGAAQRRRNAQVALTAPRALWQNRLRDQC